jgi:hypothetical protein
MNYKVYSWATLSLSALLMFSACANDDIANSENEVTLNGHKLNITINEETFEAEKPTRAAQVVHRDTIDMGDGLIAEVSIEPDKAAPMPQPAKTRAAMSEGHYTIYAVDAAGNRVADELSGTVSNGKFIPDINKKIRLDPGTYTFVCHNDAFTKTATGLSIGSGISTYPMMGTVTKTLSGGNETVSFNMKHLAARIRAQVTTYTAYAKMKSNGTYLTAVGNKFSDMEFDNRGTFQQRVSSGPTLYTRDGIESFSNDGAKPYSYYVEPFDVISSYSYIPLAENENIPANGLVYTLNGSYHGKEKQKSITIDTPLERNHTYLVKATVKTKDPLCLYQDGTVGYAGDKEVGTREPIALVINEKTATEKGMAVALKDAGQRGTPGFGYYNVGIGGDDGTINNMQGYDITYTTNYCYYPGPTPTVPPADIKSEPWETYGYAYYLAAHYNPGIQVTGSNVGKWFLASSGQWTPLLVKYGELDKSKMPSDFNIQTYTSEAHPCFAENSTTPLNTAKLASAFTQAGGTFSMDDQYPVSGTVNGGYAGYIGFTPTKVGWGYDIFVRNGTGAGLVHPFVYF